MFQAIFTDIDGTLFHSDLTIGEKTKEALRKAYSKGIRIVLSSGRYIPGIERAREQLDIPVIYAAINGALIKSGDEYLREMYICKEAYGAAAAFLKGKASSLIAFCESSYAIDADDSWYALQCRICGDMGVRMDISDPDEVEKGTGERPYKILVKDNDREKLRRLMPQVMKIVGDRATVISSGTNNFEVLPYGIDKSDAVSVITNKLGIKREDTIAFGDWDNDAGMIHAAGLGIAMGNGSENAKNASSFVTLSNDEDGIAYALEKFSII